MGLSDLSAERPELGDIDVDTPASKRGAVLKATVDYFGEDNVLNIATFGTEGSKSAILTACRGLGIDSDIGQYLTSLVPTERGNAWSLKDVYYGNPDKSRRRVADFVSEVNSHEGLLEVMMSIEGLVNKRSIHASGVYIYNDGFLNYNAMMKSPNGQKTTQFNMGDSDYMGSLKYDYLTIEALDKMSVCLDMLLEDGYIEWQGSLKSTYDKYLHPDVLNPNDAEMWELGSKGDVLDLFQFSTTVGLDAIRKIKPKNLVEAAHANSLMRLMAEPGQINPVDKYILFRDNPSLWYKEMSSYSLSESEVEVLEKYLKVYSGVSATQEDVLKILMDSDVCGLNVKDVNKVRKAIAKKKASLLEEAHNMIIASCPSKNLVRYIWDKIVMPQAGYAFSLNHTTPYTGIALQELTLYTNYPSVYWNTACLAVNSGSADEQVEGKSSDYGKIAKAIGEIRNKGIEVSLLDINKSDFGFKADVKNNEILFGLKGANSVGDDVVHLIIDNRPYSSLGDFMNRVKINKQAMISLIKGGAFDRIENLPREKVMLKYLWSTCEKKNKLTLQNLNGLIQAGLIPDELDFERRVFNFNKFLKDNKAGEYYILKEPGYSFFCNNYDEDLIELYKFAPAIKQKTWDKIYRISMDTVRDWLKDTQEETLAKFNGLILMGDRDKYAKGNISSWEMDSLCFYHSDHELINLNKSAYGVSDFGELPVEPEVDYFFKRGGKEIPIFKLSRIVGTCIDKNKTKSTVSILTTDGVVDIRFRPEYFAQFDKQLSQTQEDGSKKITEKSWFSRGSMIMVTGFRRGNQFVPKKYKATATHQLYKIDSIEKSGEIKLRSTRVGE